jgi:hypothetical protein
MIGGVPGIMKIDDIQQEPLRLTPEQNDMVRETFHAKELGEPSYSAEEVLAYARAKVRVGNLSQSA